MSKKTYEVKIEATFITEADNYLDAVDKAIDTILENPEEYCSTEEIISESKKSILPFPVY